MGFNTEAILTVPLPENEPGQLEIFRHTLSQHPGIHNVSFSFVTPASGGNWSTEFKFDNATEDAPFQVVMRPADTAYFSTYGLQLVAGRKYFHSDTIREFVVNETIVQQLGLRNPQEILGKTLSLNGTTAPVVGVVKDFHTYSLHAKSGPAVLTPFRAVYYTANIKLSTKANSLQATQEAIKHIENAWKAVYPENVFSFMFLDERIANFYTNETRMAKFFRIFTFIAIFIGSLGLYGLVSFMAVQKTKEIGIRKVLGASVNSIAWIFIKEFMKLVTLAFLVAAPIGFYTMTQWLQNFEYSITLGPSIFIGALGMSLVIAWCTVGYRAIHSALANPVKALRSE
jgi:ABC-type antimicrobial peptide transport system permease subunit